MTDKSFKSKGHCKSRAIPQAMSTTMCVVCCRRRNALCTRDRVLDHGSSAVEDLKMYMKHEQSDAKLGARTVRLDIQSTALSSLMCEAKSTRELAKNWARVMVAQKRMKRLELREHDRKY